MDVRAFCSLSLCSRACQVAIDCFEWGPMMVYFKGLYWLLIGSRRSTQTLQDTYTAAVTVRARSCWCCLLVLPAADSVQPRSPTSERLSFHLSVAC